MVGDDLLDAFGVADLLGVSKNTTYRLIRRGTLPASGQWPDWFGGPTLRTTWPAVASGPASFGT